MRIKEVAKNKLLKGAIKRIEEKYEEELKKRERGEFEEAEDSLGITILWWVSGFLLITADILEAILNLISTATGYVLFSIPYITLIFSVPGGVIFIILIWHYIRNNVIGRIEGLIYIFFVCFDIIVTFFPIIQTAGILPIKTISRFISRWRIVRLMQFRKRIKGEKKEEV
jgi:hypothetical protein